MWSGPHTKSLKIPKSKSKSSAHGSPGCVCPRVHVYICVAPVHVCLSVCIHELSAFPVHTPSGFWPEATHRAWQTNLKRVKGRSKKGKKKNLGVVFGISDIFTREMTHSGWEFHSRLRPLPPPPCTPGVSPSWGFFCVWEVQRGEVCALGIQQLLPQSMGGRGGAGPVASSRSNYHLLPAAPGEPLTSWER